MNRNGRVVMDDKVVDIMLPGRDFAFDFSRYKHIISRPWPGEEGIEKIITKNYESERMDFGSAWDQEEAKFWSGIVGFETGSSSDEATNEYRMIQRRFDVLDGVQLHYAHPQMKDILSQLELSSLTPFFEAQRFGLPTTGEQVLVEVPQMSWTTGRTATFERPVMIGGKPYLLEVKGVNFGEKPIELGSNYWDGGECNGGMTYARMKHSVEMLKHLEDHGYSSTILLAAYSLPISQFYGEQLGAYVRAVQCSPSLSHYHENLQDVAAALGMANEDFAEYVIRGATKDMAIVWKSGISHRGPVHEQNVRIGSVTDYTGSEYVRDGGFNGVAEDAQSFVDTCQKTMRRLLGPKVKYPTNDLYESNPEEAERMETEAEEKKYENQTAHYFRTREIITDELNKQLGLNLPSHIGTTSLAAQVYDMQRTAGLTNPNEAIHIEHYLGRQNEVDRKPVSLDDIMVTKNT